MGASAKRVGSDRITQSKVGVKKNSSVKNSTFAGCGLSPMMPRHYSAKERREIRKKELRILKGIT